MSVAPENFICPISQNIMTNPVSTPDGISFERSEIEKWINLRHCHPIMLSQPLSISQLVPNLALKSTIESYLASLNGVQPQLPNSINQAVPLANFQLTVNPTIMNFLNKLILTIKSISNIDRLPVHVVIVIDVSGSMADEVEIKTNNGVERNGLSKLDITKHAINTIINSLNENDMMSIVTFSTTAKLLAEAVTTNATGKMLLKTLTENMQPDSQTNIWDGLNMALNCVERFGNSHKSTSIFLLTDGVPNMEPSRGHEYMLKQQLSTMTVKCTVNTFGFGYSLNSILLRNLALIGNGLYSFIPDAGMVGTVFINSLVNQFLTFAIDPTITVKYEDETETSYNLHACRVNIDRTISIDITKPVTKVIISYVNAVTQETSKLEYLSEVFNDGSLQFPTFSLFDIDSHKDSIVVTDVDMEVVKLIQQLVTFGVASTSDGLISNFINKYNQYSYIEHVANVVENVSDQVRLAVSSNEYYTKWGKHYLLSLGFSYELQLCSNFKDKGLSKYTNKTFDILQQKLDTIFSTIPPPVPTARRSYYSGNSYSTSFSSAPINMASYNNSNAGCFSGSSVVETYHGLKLVSHVAVGDKIKSHSGKFVTVTHIVKIIDHMSSVIIMKNGLIITNGHPIYLNDQWTLPENVSNVLECKCYTFDLYDFVVDEEHIVKINGISCITLGHNLIGNNLIEHDYLGSRQVIDDIEQISEMQNTNNVITISSANIMRDLDGHIFKFSL